MLKIIRSASPLMTEIRIAAAVLPIFLYCCCNAEKKVLNDSGKTQRVVNKYLETHPARTDTVNVLLPGKTDTVTSLLIGYDTANVYNTDTVLITKTNTLYKTIFRVDTVIKTIQDNRLLKACQDGLASVDYDKKQAIVDKEIAENKAEEWRLRFWTTITLIGIVAGLAVFSKVRGVI